MEKSGLADDITLNKIEEAKQMRKVSKKNQKIKFRHEVDVVKQNMEKRDEIWKQHQLVEIWKHNMKNQNFLQNNNKKEAEAKKEIQIKTIKVKEKKIKKLAVLESEVFGRLKSTLEL